MANIGVKPLGSQNMFQPHKICTIHYFDHCQSYILIFFVSNCLILAILYYLKIDAFYKIMN